MRDGLDTRPALVYDGTRNRDKEDQMISADVVAEAVADAAESAVDFISDGWRLWINTNVATSVDGATFEVNVDDPEGEPAGTFTFTVKRTA